MNRLFRASMFLFVAVAITGAFACLRHVLAAGPVGVCEGGKFTLYKNTQCKGKLDCASSQFCAGATSLPPCPTFGYPMNFKTLTQVDSLGSCSEYNEKTSCHVCDDIYWCAEYVVYNEGIPGKECSKNCQGMFWFEGKYDACK